MPISSRICSTVTSIGSIESLLALEVDAVVRQNLLRLLYANVITAMETYLSDVFISKVSKENPLLRKFVECNKDFQNEKFSVSQVFSVYEDIETKAKKYLTEMVWHRLDRVKVLYEDVLGIKFPTDLSNLFKAIIVIASNG